MGEQEYDLTVPTNRRRLVKWWVSIGGLAGITASIKVFLFGQ
jgi:hypothetical protein